MATIEVLSEVIGVVWRLEASVGQRVEQGDILLYVESMKMEIPVLAPESGTLLSFAVTEKQEVQHDQLLAQIQSGA